MHSLLRQLSYTLKGTIGRYPALYYPLYKLRSRNRQFSVAQDSDLVIEGYPRSANTYAMVCFEYAQERPVRLAHHLHVPAQIVRAMGYGVPAIVLIRKPADAVLSLLVRDPMLTVPQALRWYFSFYETVEPYRKRFVLAPFERVIEDMGGVISDLNRAFMTDFQVFAGGEEAKESVYARIDELNRTIAKGDERHVARPMASRDELKQQRVPELQSKEHASMLQRAEAVYRRLTGGSSS